MVKPLRKAHLVVWLILATCLPIAVVIAFINIPQKLLNKASVETPVKVLSIVAGIFEDSVSSIKVRRNDRYDSQLEWELKESLTSPSNLVFAKIRLQDSCCTGNDKKVLRESPKMEHFIGALSSKGTYYFDLGIFSGDTLQVTLKDGINKRIIQTYTIKL